jgi:ParB family transcriptional regulator, chromosome partitioning protein
MIEKNISVSQLREIPTDQIQRNPENPRLFFRSEELASLMASIKRYGIQVPITVYRDRDHYVLIDGERRWRCADKLNIKKIPALILPKPSPLDNLLLMFNIHALREQWDYLTIANKLPEVINLFIQENDKEPNEIELSEATGLTRGQIRRCRLLLDLPPKYKGLLLEELSLPKPSQQLSEDFFIEMERSLKTVQNRLPTAIKDLDEVRDTLIAKFRSGVIDNVTEFRKLSKIATSISNLGVREVQARKAIKEIFNAKNEVSIDEVYSEHYEFRYDERKVVLSIESLTDYLEGTISEDELPPLGEDVLDHLRKLQGLINKVLGDYR